MLYSEIDSSKPLTDDVWAVSILTTTTQTLGHTLVAVEGLTDGARLTLVADLVPLIRNRNGDRATKKQLALGEMNNTMIEGQVLIREGGTVLTKVGSKFWSKTWTVTRENGMRMYERIHSEQRENSHKVLRSARAFQLLGQFSEISDATIGGINCANWSQMMLREAGIQDQGGVVLDIPLTATLPGSRSNWIQAAAAATAVYIVSRL